MLGLNPLQGAERLLCERLNALAAELTAAADAAEAARSGAASPPSSPRGGATRSVSFASELNSTLIMLY